MNILTSFARSRISFAATAASAVLAVFLSACSSGDHAGGNSAESGNPEFAGMISLPDGSPAVAARVRFVPSDFNAYSDTLPDSLETVTDTLGRYALSAPSAEFAVESFDAVTGMRLLSRGLTVKMPDGDTLSDTLRLPGVLRIGVSSLVNGDSGIVYAPGTTILRKVKMKFGALFVDSLPAAHFDTLMFIPSSGAGFALPLPDSGVNIPAGDTLVISAPSISISFKAPLAFPDGDSLGRVLTDFPIALRLDSSVMDFSVMASLSGQWEAVRASRPSTTLPIARASFDLESQKAVFWVRVDSLLSKDTILLTFREGKDTLLAKDVFPYNSSGDRFIASWHFDDGVLAVKNSVIDSTFSTLEGVPSNVSETEGVLGKAFLYDGTSSFVDIANTASGPLNFAALDTFSISAWVRLDDMSTSRFVFGKGSTQYSLKFFYNADSSSWLFERYAAAATGSMRYWILSNILASSAVGEWKLLTVVQRDSTVDVYVNDTLVSTAAKIGMFETSRDESSDFEIGRRVVSADSAGQYFKGAIDEMQVNETARDSNWVRVTYWNGRPDKIWPVVTKN